jgi:hypothetical protein
MARQAATFATPRPSHWQEKAARASVCFYDYHVWVRGFLPARHHYAIIERLLFGDRLELILGWPDAAKSTIGVSFAEWRLGRNPNFRWLIASEVATGIATTIVQDIAGTIESNERYLMTFGELKDPVGKTPWSTQQLFLRPLVTPMTARSLKMPVTPPPPFPWLPPRGRDQRLTGRHPNVKAVGWRTGYAGARCEGIIADDLVSDRVSRSQKLTDQVFATTHQKLMGRMTPHPDNLMVVFGQHYGARDFYSLVRRVGVVVYDNNPDMEGLDCLERGGRTAAA